MISIPEAMISILGGFSYLGLGVPLQELGLPYETLGFTWQGCDFQECSEMSNQGGTSITTPTVQWAS